MLYKEPDQSMEDQKVPGRARKIEISSKGDMLRSDDLDISGHSQPFVKEDLSMNYDGFILQTRIKVINQQDDQPPAYWPAREKNQDVKGQPAMLYWMSCNAAIETAFVGDFFCWKKLNSFRVKYVELPEVDQYQ